MLDVPPAHRFILDDLWHWFDVGGVNLDIAFWLDPLSMLMALIVTGVGGLIHIYSTGYMHDDPGYRRFLLTRFSAIDSFSPSSGMTTQATR